MTNKTTANALLAEDQLQLVRHQADISILRERVARLEAERGQVLARLDAELQRLREVHGRIVSEYGLGQEDQINVDTGVITRNTPLPLQNGTAAEQAAPAPASA